LVGFFLNNKNPTTMGENMSAEEKSSGVKFA